MTREMFNKMKEKRERIDVIFFVLGLDALTIRKDKVEQTKAALSLACSTCGLFLSAFG